MNPFDKIKEQINEDLHHKLPKKWKKIGDILIADFSLINTNHLSSFRRAVYPIRDLIAGEILKEEDLTILRPNLGIDARNFHQIVGKRLDKNIKAFEPLDWSMLS